MGFARMTNRIWWLMGPLLIMATILTLPVANTDAYGAVPVSPTASFAAQDQAVVVTAAVDGTQVVHALEPVSNPFRCDTSCSPTNPLNHTAHQARYELPSDRFAALLAQSVPLHLAHAGLNAMTKTVVALFAASPPLPPPQI